MFDAALAELSGLPKGRVSALLHDRSGASLRALLKRAGLPESTFAAFHVALEACHEGGFAGTVVGKPSLFGWDFNAIAHPGRYAIVCMLFFTLVALQRATDCPI